jgi:hypothetical protein
VGLLELLAHVVGDGLHDAVDRGEGGILGRTEHAPHRDVVGGELVLPGREVGPAGLLEERLLGDRQGVGVDEGAAADADAREHRDVAKEGHLKQTSPAEAWEPQPALEVPVGLREVGFGPSSLPFSSMRTR